MARTYDAITDHLRDWVERQAMFFVATAPLGGFNGPANAKNPARPKPDAVTTPTAIPPKKPRDIAYLPACRTPANAPKVLRRDAAP